MSATDDFKLWTFSNETISELASEFRYYFNRSKGIKMSIRDADTVVSHVAGYQPLPKEPKAIDYTSLSVSGGGVKARPSANQVDEIYNRIQQEYADNSEWDEVFDEVVESNRQHSGTLKLIYMTFREKHMPDTICSELSISRTTYFRLRRVVLEQAGMIALKKELLDH